MPELTRAREGAREYGYLAASLKQSIELKPRWPDCLDGASIHESAAHINAAYLFIVLIILLSLWSISGLL
jgi:hypothetical protein